MSRPKDGLIAKVNAAVDGRSQPLAVDPGGGLLKPESRLRQGGISG